MYFAKNTKAYLKKANGWDQEILATALLSRNRAWALSFICLALLGLSLCAHLLILPLKSFEPYVISVDRSSGYAQITRKLEAGSLNQERAITESNLVRYVSMREQYNPAILKENYQNIALMSDKKAAQEYKDLWSASNPNNPSKLYGLDEAITIQIKSVSFISENIASVRFVKTKSGLENARMSHWMAVIEFEYTNKPAKMLERFQNPLGFKVLAYRTNPETKEILK